MTATAGPPDEPGSPPPATPIGARAARRGEQDLPGRASEPAAPTGHNPTSRAAVADGHTAVVPDRLFAARDTEARWRARFSATRLSLPDPARDAPGRTVLVSNASGRFEVYFWNPGGEPVQATDRSAGTTYAELAADGETLWWFNDSDGDEFGSWVAQPFGSPPGSGHPALPEVAPGYPAGLAVGRAVVLAGFSDDDGSRVHMAVPESEPQQIYASASDASVGALSTDETIWVLAHSEHGDSRYPALRAFSLADGTVLGELDDTPGRGLQPLRFSPVPGDQRLLAVHERRGRDELLLWNVSDGTVQEVPINLPGDLDGDFFPDGSALLVIHTHQARTTLHRFDPRSGTLARLPAMPGVVGSALTRPDGSVWYRVSNAAQPPQLRQLTAAGADSTLLAPPGPAAPGSQPLTDVWVDGPAGRIHALLAVPAGAHTDGTGPLPTVFYLHGGPAAADEDDYDATRAAYLDAGLAVVHVNYRGSTGYGSAWRDAIDKRVGHTELADVAAVHDHLVAHGVVDATRSVIAGGSWGGYLTLLALGAQPSRWAAGIAAVPVADYVTAYADEMEPLRAYDRALFGGSPSQVPDRYQDSSPLTYADQVTAPLLVTIGENDPRCPTEQIENYLAALDARSARYAVYRFDAGHGSMVVGERIRQVCCEIDFVRRALGLGVQG